MKERIAALAEYEIMDTAAEPEFDRITRLASVVCDAPVSLISLLDDRRQWFKSKIGFGGNESRLEDSICKYVLQSPDLLEIPDAREDERCREIAMVKNEPHIRFYVGAPLITPQGVPIGSLCAVDFKPRELNPEQRKVLPILASEVIDLLEYRRTARRKTLELGKMARREIRLSTNLQLNMSLQLMELIAEIIHDSVDPLLMLSSVLHAICRHTGWSLARAWVPAVSGSQRKEDLEAWRLDKSPAATVYREFVQASPVAASAFLREAVESCAALTMPVLRDDIEHPTSPLLHHYDFSFAVAVPIFGNKLLGAMEFYSQPRSMPDHPFLKVLKDIGSLVGTALEREQTRIEMQLSEAYFRHMVMDSLDIISILDADGTIRFESQSITRDFGWTPAEMIGSNAFEFVHPEDKVMVGSAFKQSLVTSGPTALLCFRFRHRDGSYRYLEGRGNNLLSNPAVRGVVFTSRDVTEKKQLEQQFGQLAGGIAHDFNNLLGVVIGYSSVLEVDKVADLKTRNALKEVRNAAQKVAGLTGQLLAFSGRQIMQPVDLPLDECLAESQKSLGVLIGDTTRIRFVPGAGGAYVHADPVQLDNVLLNLILNARDALGNDGEIILRTTKCTTIDGPYNPLPELPVGDYAVIQVADAGCGMSDEVRAHIFEPYFTTKPRGKGSGLGLAACQGIIHQSHGRITATSKLGSGSAFSIYLPLVSAPVLEEKIIDHPAHAKHEGQTILFAEDEDALREFGTVVLEEAGYRVLAGENGRVALDLARAGGAPQFDLLLTDIMMPEMDGKELAENIRQQHPEVPIIFCSGFAQDPSFYEGLPENMYFLPKPYTVSALLKIVGQFLQAS
ncbi:MAG: response regulator [Chthoniobacteraceae bacterium]